MILPWLWLAILSNMEQRLSERTMQLTAWDSAGVAYTVTPTTHRRTSDTLHANDVTRRCQGRSPACVLASG